jgi:hypothetical protein
VAADNKTCRVCGDVLDCHDYGGGSVWSCTTHGVREWQFGDVGAHWPVPSKAWTGASAAVLDRAPRGPQP